MASTPPTSTTDTALEPPVGDSNSVTSEQDVDAALADKTEQTYVAATLAELRKVVWPSRQQLFSESVAVILMVSLSAAAIAAIDRFYGWISSQVFS